MDGVDVDINNDDDNVDTNGRNGCNHRSYYRRIPNEFSVFGFLLNANVVDNQLGNARSKH